MARNLQPSRNTAKPSRPPNSRPKSASCSSPSSARPAASAWRAGSVRHRHPDRAKHWMRNAAVRKTTQPIYKEFADAVERARSEFLLFAAATQPPGHRRHHRPAEYTISRTIRSATASRTATSSQPGYPCACPTRYVEKVVMPNPNMLMWQVDRLDAVTEWRPGAGSARSRPHCRRKPK